MHCVRFDVYSHEKLITTNVVRFQTSKHAENVINRWNEMGSGSKYKWSYRNISKYPSQYWNPKNPSHSDHVTLDTHLV